MRVSVGENAVLMACVVMGIEFFLILVYVRIQVLVAARNRIERAVRAELLRPGAYAGEDPPADRPSLESMYSTLCFDPDEKTGVLIGAVYALTAVLFLTAIFRVPFSPLDSLSAGTMMCVAAASLAVFASMQWGFLKLVVLPHYARLYNKLVVDDIPVFESDPARVTGVLLAPAMVFVAAFAFIAVAFFGAVDWPVVGFAALMAVVGITTEVLTWVAITGYSLPLRSTASAMSDAITAVLWVNRSNPPEVALDVLHRAWFPDASSMLSVENVFQNTYRELFARKRLSVDGDGDLVIVAAPTDRVLSSVLVTACALMMLVPVVTVVFRGDAFDSVLFASQVLGVLGVYGVFIAFAGDTATMSRVAKF